MLLHHSEELDDDFGGWTDENLALARLFGVIDGVERIVEDGGLDHFEGCMWRFSMAEGAIEVSIHMMWSASSSQSVKECPQSATT